MLDFSDEGLMKIFHSIGANGTKSDKFKLLEKNT